MFMKSLACILLCIFPCFCASQEKNSYVHPEQEVTLFPNPLRKDEVGKLQVGIFLKDNISKKRAELYDLFGINVLNIDFERELDVSRLEKGIYLTRILLYNDDRIVHSVTKKLIIH